MNTMKNRIISISLAILMLFALLPVNAMAVDTPEQSNIQASKSAQWVDQANGIAEITIKVKGDPSSTSTHMEKTDIVLVVDESSSMDSSNKMKNAKAAAEKFVDKLLTDAHQDAVRIAVVGYAKQAWDVKEFSSNANTVKQNIRSLRTYDGWETAGTNVQAGIHSARELLKNKSTAKNKIMVILTDGDPNFSYRFVATAAYTGCERWTDDGCELFDPTGGQITNVGVFAPDYSDIVDEQDSPYLSNGNARVTATCTKHGGQATQNGVYNGTSYDATTTETNHGVATIWEAAQAKSTAENVTIYAIGYGITANSFAETMMKSVANDGKYYSSDASSTAIDGVFNSIANEIEKFTAYKAYVIDKMGAGFTVDPNTPLPAGASLQPDGSIKWDVAEELDDTEHTLTFRVKYDTRSENLVEGANLPTNDGAELKYALSKDGEANQSMPIENASVPNGAKKVSYFDGYSEDGKAGVSGEEYADKLYWLNTTVDSAPAPRRDGYRFLGWDILGATLTNGKFTIGNSNVILTAKWELDTIDITVTKVWDTSVPEKERTSATVVLCDANGNPINSVDPLTLNADNSFTGKFLGVPKSGTYTVKETYANNVEMTNGTGEVRGTNADDNTTYLISTWTATVAEPTANTFTVTNEKNDEPTYSVSYTFEGDHPSDAQAPGGQSGLYAGQDYQISGAPLYTDNTHNNIPGTWTFNGWKRGGNVVIGTTIKITGDTELVGTWTFTADTAYKVTYEFVAEGGGTLPSDVTDLKPENTDAIYYNGNSVLRRQLQESCQGASAGRPVQCSSGLRCGRISSGKSTLHAPSDAKSNRRSRS